MSTPRDERLPALFVWLVALHSYAVGVGLLLLPHLTLPFGGFPLPQDLFFVRQGGVFHLVVATGFLMEWHAHRGISLMAMTKCFATVFLCASWLLIADPPWLVGASALQDGTLAVIALWLVRSRRVAAAAR
ncbi:MAG: hypothetical protein PVJ49_06975 [Acidobacteriota bacterium]